MRPPVETLERFARGASDLTERLIVEAHLRLCPDSEALVRSAAERDPETADWESLVAARSAAQPDSTQEGTGALPATLMEKIKSMPQSGVMRETESAASGSTRRFPGTMPSRGGRGPGSEIPLPHDILNDLRPRQEWKWLPLWPCRGSISLVKTDPVTGTALYCARLKPGSPTPRHRHSAREEALVLTGAYRYDGVEVRAGDYDVKEPGTEHAPRILPGEDCWVLVRQGAPRSPRFTGSSIWRRPLVALLRMAGIPGA